MHLRFPANLICLRCVTVVTISVFAISAAWGAEGLDARRADIDRQFQEKLAVLAEKCDKLELPAQATATREWFIPRSSRYQYFFLPADGDRAKPAANTPTVAQQWHDRFMKLRAEQADALFPLAKSVAIEGRSSKSSASWAHQLLYEVLRENPDHLEARRALGYLKIGTEWRFSPKEGKPTQPRFDHPQLTWRKGQYWRLETEHFRISTNQSAKAAVDLGQRLEELHTVWRQLFFRYWCSGESFAARMQGGKEPLAKSRQHEVVLFRNREEYVTALNRDQPQVGLTLGLYADKQQTSYFYAGDDSARATWFHEVTHQLFQETVEIPTGAGTYANIWAIEAVALYMESLQRLNGYCTLGGIDADRLQFARYRTLRGDFNMPLEKLAAYGRESLQRDPDIRRLYVHAAGLAHFLMDDQGGRYRENFIDYLIAIYQRRDKVDTLAAMTRSNLTDLDRQYLDFLKNVRDADLQTLSLAERAKNLCLGQTAVTDAGLINIAGTKQLELLDLGTTKTTDAGLRAFRPSQGLKQLFFEQTQLSDVALDWISTLANLEELDLSNTRVTDAGLAKIGKIKSLKKLYLFNCDVSDAGIRHLHDLKQLEDLEFGGTKVTAKALQELKGALPKFTPAAR